MNDSSTPQIISKMLQRDQAILVAHHTNWRSFGLFALVCCAAIATFGSYVAGNWLQFAVFSLALIAASFEFYHGASYYKLQMPAIAARQLYKMQDGTLIAAQTVQEAQLIAHLLDKDADQLDLSNHGNIFQFD